METNGTVAEKPDLTAGTADGKRARRVVSVTAEDWKHIANSVRSGGFLWTACESLGIPYCLVEYLLEQGKPRMNPDGSLSCHPTLHGPYLEVAKAMAQARLSAEVNACKGEAGPRFWLRFGPGRDAPGRPGWAAAGQGQSTTVTVNQTGQTANVFEANGVQAILKALEPFPQAYEAAIAAFGAVTEEALQEEERNIFQDPIFLSWVRALERFPEARKAIAEATRREVGKKMLLGFAGRLRPAEEPADE
jgi:hypothetical protein